jgi:cyclophilin family peptidyl-prolyl cis-trans isomerase
MKRLFAFFAATLLSLAAVHALAANPSVIMETNQGTIVVELYPDKAPKTVANFLQYVNDGYYNGTIFHRVIDGFMIQGGGFDAQLHEKATRAAIQNEAANGLKNDVGTLAMARTGDPHSATAQFFINLVNNGALDYPSRDGWGYAVFGKVTQGLDVVKKIGQVHVTTLSAKFQNIPETPVIIQSARLVAEKK